MAHTAQARSQRGDMGECHDGKIAKNMHRNDEFSRNFQHFSSDVPLRQKNATFFKHGFQISKHVRACRHVKLGPGNIYG